MPLTKITGEVIQVGTAVSVGIITATSVNVGSAVTIDASGINVTGVVTASSGFRGSLTGNVTGNATGLSGTPNITVGTIGATSLNATGVVTATSFVGNVTGNATGLSGTPSITVGAIIASSATISGNVSVAGTVTYEDTTNVDSIGVVTARSGLIVNSGSVGIFTATPRASVQIGAATSQSVFISSVGNVGLASTNPRVSLDASQETDAIALPQGTTAQRPTGNNPYIRWNTTNSALEVYNGTDWVEIITDYFPTGSVILG